MKTPSPIAPRRARVSWTGLWWVWKVGEDRGGWALTSGEAADEARRYLRG